MLLQESACNSRIYLHQISTLKKKKNHSTLTRFHSKLQQAKRTPALCSSRLLPKGRSWNKHGIVSQWLARLQMLQSYLLLHGTNCSTFRKTKKPNNLYFSAPRRAPKYAKCISTPHTRPTLSTNEELIVCGSYWNLPTYSVPENMSRFWIPFEENELEWKVLSKANLNWLLG